MHSGVAVGAGAESHADSKEHEKVQEQSLHYQERITELHTIISELNEKIGFLQCTTIREDDVFSELSSELCHGQQEANEDEHNVDQDPDQVSFFSLPKNQSMPTTAAIDNCSELNLELQRVLRGLESVVCGHKKIVYNLSVAEVDGHIEQLAADSQHCEFAIKTVEEVEGTLGKDVYPSLYEERVRWEEELASLQEENESLTAMLSSKDKAHNCTRATISAIREERDRLRFRVTKLQTCLQSVQPGEGPSPSGRVINSITSSSNNDLPVTKRAERVKLSICRSESSLMKGAVLGSEMNTTRVSSNVGEHLSHTQVYSNIQEIFQTLYLHGSAISNDKIQEFEVETERLNSRIEHLKSQNDLLTITLEECKSNAERMSILLGKYESSASALHLALYYSERCIEAYDLLLALAETEQLLVLGQYRVASVRAVGEKGSKRSISQMLLQANVRRKTAENAAKDLLVRLDSSCGGFFTVADCKTQPFKSLSSNIHTSTTITTTSSDTDFSKKDEQRLKNYIRQLKNDQAAIKLTMLKLEGAHILSYDIKPHADSHRLDLENAVLMQELMAMKEEMAELKAQLYLLEKEKKTLELNLKLVNIKQLKSKVEEQEEKCRGSLSSRDYSTKDKSAKDSDTSVINVSELSGLNDCDLAAELNNALHKEMQLKVQVKDLVSELEKFTKSSEIQHQQSAGFISDLKRANSHLVAAYDKAKKKHQNKLRKLESQMMAMMERHETQVHMLKQRITLLEEEMSHPHTNETSL
ncbi:colorectal mutant cancer protein isoform 2-T4 [Clarias gariepinus]|uniref:colorectal mutant cancer protein isoform X2 n=1 Tax=Clarias gariepinus TaxID=13013 RepID=UPI00234CDDAD|nr:colorectal mutant cancer protein isoform X2 [Clarias gariepinus]